MIFSPRLSLLQMFEDDRLNFSLIPSLLFTEKMKSSLFQSPNLYKVNEYSKPVCSLILTIVRVLSICPFSEKIKGLPSHIFSFALTHSISSSLVNVVFEFNSKKLTVEPK